MTSGEGDAKVWGTHHHTWLSAAVNWAVCDGEHAHRREYPTRLFHGLVQGPEDAGAAWNTRDPPPASITATRSLRTSLCSDGYSSLHPDQFIKEGRQF